MQIIKIIMENMIDIPQNTETTATIWPNNWPILSAATKERNFSSFPKKGKPLDG